MNYTIQIRCKVTNNWESVALCFSSSLIASVVLHAMTIDSNYRGYLIRVIGDDGRTVVEAMG